MLALILFALAPVNDMFSLLLCLLAVYYFRKPERNRVGQAVIIGAAFLTLVLAPVVFRAANMWLPRRKARLRNQPAMVGYVLTTDPRYATVLKVADSTVKY
jgi:formate hydrogenlyase subunit 3/multisubunit Na+/H+ antiporter MnhD subunit